MYIALPPFFFFPYFILLLLYLISFPVSSAFVIYLLIHYLSLFPSCLSSFSSFSFYTHFFYFYFLLNILLLPLRQSFFLFFIFSIIFFSCLYSFLSPFLFSSFSVSCFCTQNVYTFCLTCPSDFSSPSSTFSSCSFYLLRSLLAIFFLHHISLLFFSRFSFSSLYYSFIYSSHRFSSLQPCYLISSEPSLFSSRDPFFFFISLLRIRLFLLVSIITFSRFLFHLLFPPYSYCSFSSLSFSSFFLNFILPSFLPSSSLYSSSFLYSCFVSFFLFQFFFVSFFFHLLYYLSRFFFFVFFILPSIFPNSASAAADSSSCQVPDVLDRRAGLFQVDSDTLQKMCHQRATRLE